MSFCDCLCKGVGTACLCSMSCWNVSTAMKFLSSVVNVPLFPTLPSPVQICQCSAKTHCLLAYVVLPVVLFPVNMVLFIVIYQDGSQWQKHWFRYVNEGYSIVIINPRKWYSTSGSGNDSDDEQEDSVTHLIPRKRQLDGDLKGTVKSVTFMSQCSNVDYSWLIEGFKKQNLT